MIQDDLGEDSGPSSCRYQCVPGSLREQGSGLCVPDLCPDLGHETMPTSLPRVPLGTAGIFQVPGNPRDHSPCSSTPAGPATRYETRGQRTRHGPRNKPNRLPTRYRLVLLSRSFRVRGSFCMHDMLRKAAFSGFLIGFESCRGQPLSGTQGKRVATFALLTTAWPEPRPARSTPGEPGRAVKRQAFATLSYLANPQALHNRHIGRPGFLVSRNTHPRAPLGVGDPRAL